VKPHIAIINYDDCDLRLFLSNSRVAAMLGEGMWFSHAYAPQPLCGPSRAALLTGKHAHNNGIKSNGGKGQNPAAWSVHLNNTLPDWMKLAGYRTIGAGKYGVNGVDKTVLTGWDVKLNALNRGSLEGVYWMDNLLSRTLDELASSLSDGNTTFLYYAPASPHGPLTPSSVYNGSADNTEMPVDPSFNEADVSDKRWKHKDLPLLTADQEL
jgi:uncharacterized sulfatase